MCFTIELTIHTLSIELMLSFRTLQKALATIDVIVKASEHDQSINKEKGNHFEKPH